MPLLGSTASASTYGPLHGRQGDRQRREGVIQQERMQEREDSELLRPRVAFWSPKQCQLRMAETRNEAKK